MQSFLIHLAVYAVVLAALGAGFYLLLLRRYAATKGTIQHPGK